MFESKLPSQGPTHELSVELDSPVPCVKGGQTGIPNQESGWQVKIPA